MSDPRYAAEFLSDAGFASQETKREKLATIIRALDEADRLRATVARLERVIKEYAHHRSKCNSLYYHADGNAYCDCGFDAALAAKGET